MARKEGAQVDTFPSQMYGKNASKPKALAVDSDGKLLTSSIASLSISNAIDETSYDLNAAAFSETTDISNDYVLDNIELNFSTDEEKTIVVLSSDGTVLWADTNTDTSVHLSNMNIGFNADENVTVTVTQFSSAGTMDCILKVRQGSETLTGSPVLGAGNEVIGKVKVVHADDTEGALISGVNYVPGKSGIDSVTNALDTIDYSQHEIHSGSHYYIQGYIELDDTETFYVKMVTQNTTKWSHFIFNIKSTGICTTYFDEDATGGMTGGSGVTPINNNRNSDNVSGVVFTSGVTACTGYAKRLESDKWGDTGFKQSIGGSGGREDELILKQNTVYCRSFVSGSDGNIIQFRASWYEHANKN